MANMQLHSWLQNPTDFAVGLRLLDKYCPGKHITFKNHARKFGENSFYKQKLFGIIKDLNGLEVAEEQIKKTKVVKHRKNLKITREELPEDLQQLWDTRLALFKEAAYWHARFLTLSPAQQKSAIEKIITNRDRINEIWEKLDYYKINGKRKTEPQPLGETEYFMALKRYHTLRTYKSKYRRAPEKWAKHADEFERVEKIVNAKKDASI